MNKKWNSKKLNFLMSTILGFATALAYAEDVEIPVETLLAPKMGYEQKNDIQVVVYGFLPNSCYDLAHNEIDRNLINRTVKVHQYAYRNREGICEGEDSSLSEEMKQRRPFVKEVSVGRLLVGDFTFIFKKPDGELGKRILNVAPNVKPTVDSLPYAIVSNATVPDVINGADDIQVTIAGTLTSTCMALDDQVRITKEEDVFILQPTVTRKTGDFCAEVLISYRKKVNLGKAAPGTYLIHTRSMNGNAVNRVISITR